MIYQFTSGKDYPLVTYGLIICCVLISVPTWINPSLKLVFGASLKPDFFWQPFTAPFEHGGPYLGLFAHFVLNMLALWYCGSLVERILGHWRTLFPAVLSIAVYVVLLWFVLKWRADGASIFIWSYAPLVLGVLIIMYRQKHWAVLQNSNFISGCLALAGMWGIPTVVFSTNAIRAGDADSILEAVVYHANAFHIAPTIIGSVFAFLWWQDLRKGMQKSPVLQVQDKVALAVVTILILFLGTLMVLTLTNTIQIPT